MSAPQPDPQAPRTPSVSQLLEELAAALQGSDAKPVSAVRALERRLLKDLGAARVVACNGRSAAFEIAFRALGVEAGDEAVLPTLAHPAAAIALARLGAEPVFADVDPISFRLSAMTAAACMGPRTKLLVPSAFAGHWPVDEALEALAQDAGAAIVVDAGAWPGVRSRAQAEATDAPAVISVYELAGAFGPGTLPGAALATENRVLATRFQRLRNSGVATAFPASRGSWDHLVTHVGVDAELGAVQAGLLGALYEGEASAAEQRRMALTALVEKVSASKLPLEAVLPSAGSAPRHLALFLDAQRAPSRDLVLGALERRGIAATVEHPLLHRQPAFSGAARVGEMPNATAWIECGFLVPLPADSSESTLTLLVTALRESLLGAAGRNAAREASGADVATDASTEA